MTNITGAHSCSVIHAWTYVQKYLYPSPKREMRLEERRASFVKGHIPHRHNKNIFFCKYNNIKRTMRTKNGTGGSWRLYECFRGQYPLEIWLNNPMINFLWNSQLLTTIRTLIYEMLHLQNVTFTVDLLCRGDNRHVIPIYRCTLDTHLWYQWIQKGQTGTLMPTNLKYFWRK